MRKTLFAAVIVLLAVLCGCQEAQYGSLSVESGRKSGSAKTIAPDAAEITCASYRVTGECCSDKSRTFSVDSNDGTATVENLLVGDWKVYAEGYNADGVMIAQSDAETVEILPAQSQSVTLELEYIQAGSGSITIIVNVPAEGSNIDVVEFTVGGALQTSELATEVDGDEYLFHCYSESWPTGRYAVCVRFYAATGEQLGPTCTETAYVFSGMDSRLELTALCNASRPSISPSQGTVPNGTEVTLSTDTDGAEIHYTLDGSTPTMSSPVYTEPIEVTGNTTVKAFAWKAGMYASTVATAVYRITE